MAVDFVPLFGVYKLRPGALELIFCCCEGPWMSICVGLVCGHIPILPTRVISVLGLKSTLENPQIQVYFAGNGLLAGENGWPFRRFCGGGGGLPAPLLAPRALILRTKQRLDALSRPTPPYFGHA